VGQCSVNLDQESQRGQQMITVNQKHCTDDRSTFLALLSVGGGVPSLNSPPPGGAHLPGFPVFQAIADGFQTPLGARFEFDFWLKPGTDRPAFSQDEIRTQKGRAAGGAVLFAFTKPSQPREVTPSTPNGDLARSDHEDRGEPAWEASSRPAHPIR
jgi:hypothetical protein